MGKVFHLRTVTKLDLNATQILQAAIEEDLDGVIILGYKKDGDEYLASSYADGGTALWLMERVKMRLMKIATDLVDPS